MIKGLNIYIIFVPWFVFLFLHLCFYLALYNIAIDDNIENKYSKI